MRPGPPRTALEVKLWMRLSDYDRTGSWKRPGRGSFTRGLYDYVGILLLVDGGGDILLVPSTWTHLSGKEKVGTPLGLWSNQFLGFQSSPVPVQSWETE